MPLQTWIHHWEEGAGSRAMKSAAALLAFVALAALYNLLSYSGFPSEEGMENAQLARNIAQGKGYTTDSIRPLTLYLLANAAAPGQSSAVLAKPVPDLSVPPVYPLLLAGLMKILPFKFEAGTEWLYAPERWIGIFNQVLFFATVMVLFFLARWLFDARVAWLTAIFFAGTRLFWKFTTSGLSTIWIMLIFLLIVWLLAAMERRDRTAEEGTGKNLFGLSLLTGILTGVLVLSRYSLAWLLIPILVFIWLSIARGKGKSSLLILCGCALVAGPWLARNIQLSGHPFGTADFSALQETSLFPNDTLERSSDPHYTLMRIAPLEVFNKFLLNAREICVTDLPKLGGNWVTALFLASLFVPFVNLGLSRLRWFLAGSLFLLFVIQAFNVSHVSRETPEINSENLLVVLSPLIFMYGAAFFHILLDQLNLTLPDARAMIMGLFVFIFCAPFLFSLLVGHSASEFSPYTPRHIQQVAQLMETNELMASDIPSAVAWYGGRSCAWMPLNDNEEFFKVNALKPIKAVFLTQKTTDERYLSQMKSDATGWGRFVLECAEHGEIPAGFPLRKAPTGLLPEQLFLSDKVRWR